MGRIGPCAGTAPGGRRWLEILRQFHAAVVDGEAPETAAEDNLDSLAMVMACMRSIEEGSVVELPLSIGS
jgi:predicted dehydrogenase